MLRRECLRIVILVLVFSISCFADGDGAVETTMSDGGGLEGKMCIVKKVRVVLPFYMRVGVGQTSDMHIFSPITILLPY